MENLSTESVPIYVNCRLITPDDIRYLDTAEMIFGREIEADDRVLPILSVRCDKQGFSIDPEFSNVVSLEVEEYIENKPHIGREIMRTEISDVEDSQPIGKPHTKDIIIGIGSYNPEYRSLIIDFNFDEVLDIQNQN